MDSTENQLLTKRNIITLLAILILLLAIPIAVQLIQKSQIFKSRAAVDPIVFPPGPNITQTPDGSFTTTSTNLQVQLNSPKRAAPPTPTPPG